MIRASSVPRSPLASAPRSDLAAPPRAEAGARLPVGFVIFQTGNRANGGVESITQVVERVRRVEPVIVTQMETPTTERWRRGGAEVHVLPAAFEAWSRDRGAIRHVPRNNAWMARFVRRRGLAVVHVNDIAGFVNIGAGARAGGARLVLNVRDVKPADQRYTIKWRLAASMADRVVALSREMAADVVSRLTSRLFFGHPQVEHVYSAVDLQQMRPAATAERRALRARLELPDDRFVLAYVAAFNAKKAQLDFIEHGLAEIAEQQPNALVCFVGDFRPEGDPYARRCAEVVAARGLQRFVRFVGFSADVADWYRAADAVLLASRHEGLARCMIEGLACGTPSISFDVCSAREILEERDCGLVVASGDYRALAAAVAQLATNLALRERLRGHAIATAADLFDPPRSIARYEDLYTMLAGWSDG